MQRTRNKLGMLTSVVAMAAGMMSAQSLKISPSYENVVLGGKQQFLASTMGIQPEGVTWQVASAGGGSIDATGLYTAPAVMPAQSPVSIKAISKGMPTTTQVAYVNLLTAGPVITMATPNPLPSGTYTIKITGSPILVGAMINCNNVQLSNNVYTATTVSGIGYVAPSATTLTCYVKNPGTGYSNALVVPVKAATSGGNNGGGSTPTPVVAPATASVVLGATQQFTASNVTSWTALAGTVSASGLYTAPAQMTATGYDTVTATGTGGSSIGKISLISNVAPAVTQLSLNSLPQGTFNITMTGTGFTSLSKVTLGSLQLTTTYVNPTTLTLVGFASQGGLQNLIVSNGPITSLPFQVQVGPTNPQVSAGAARRFLEQAAFGPTPTEALHVQQVGFQGWLNEQFAMPQVSNYNGSANQSGMSTLFLTNAVMNQDQLRQKVAFALSQIVVTSLNKIIWTGPMAMYQEMLMANSFGNFRKLLGDVTLSPVMGQYLDMANNGKANPVTGMVANENYAREILQLFSLGTKVLNQDGTVPLDVNNNPIPTYTQVDVTEFARVFTGWTYAPAPGGNVIWGAYQNQNGPMVPYPAQHDTGAKTLLNGYVSPAGLSAAQDLNNALDNIFNHPNVGPFISRLLIQHTVKSNPTPAYIQRVASVFADNGQGVRGDLKAVVTAILLDSEARTNDTGALDSPNDGHLQEPVLLIAGFVRAFGGIMTNQNYFGYTLTNLGQDIYNAPSVFNYYSPGFRAPGVPLAGPEFQIHTPNNAIGRSNLVAGMFNAYNNAVQTNGPGTTLDLSGFVPLASNPAALVDALDFTLTHGAMPAAMKQIVVNAVTNDSAGSISRVETGATLIIGSNYYNVWH
ncbi:MAG: DUF1800 family protein [Acidobacteriia bacterium]|nr:DUF1800 family protein [Terriglobia bacterium]